MQKLHKKIEALRKSIGTSPIHRFYAQDHENRAPKVTDDSRLIKQYFCIFGIRDNYGTAPIKGAFSKSIQERGPQSKATSKIVVLNQHDQRDPLCLPLVLKEDDIGLYAEYEPDPMPSGDRLLMQVRRGTINNGSYGFDYVWDKMEYDEPSDTIYMMECELFEISPVTFGSQPETYVKRSASGEMEDEFLIEETDELIKKLPRNLHLEIRNIIDRHISLAKLQPLETRQSALEIIKPKNGGLDYQYLLDNLKILQ